MLPPPPLVLCFFIAPAHLDLIKKSWEIGGREGVEVRRRAGTRRRDRTYTQSIVRHKLHRRRRPGHSYAHRRQEYKCPAAPERTKNDKVPPSSHMAPKKKGVIRKMKTISEKDGRREVVVGRDGRSAPCRNRAKEFIKRGEGTQSRFFFWSEKRV